MFNTTHVQTIGYTNTTKLPQRLYNTIHTWEKLAIAAALTSLAPEPVSAR